jgi:galactose oxidase
MFCPGTSLLADGRLLITGGKFGVMTTLYDPWDDTWTSATNMTVERGYHAQLTLSDGRIFVLGGSWSGTLGNKYGELYDPSTQSWTPKRGTTPEGTILTNDVEGLYRTDNHMWLFEASNGQVFHAGPAKITHWIDLDGNGSITTSVYVRVPIDAFLSTRRSRSIFLYCPLRALQIFFLLPIGAALAGTTRTR